MGLEEDIVKLLKSEGYRINEAIRDALDEFLDTRSMTRTRTWRRTSVTTTSRRTKKTIEARPAPARVPYLAAPAAGVAAGCGGAGGCTAGAGGTAVDPAGATVAGATRSGSGCGSRHGRGRGDRRWRSGREVWPETTADGGPARSGLTAGSPPGLRGWGMLWQRLRQQVVGQWSGPVIGRSDAHRLAQVLAVERRLAFEQREARSEVFHVIEIPGVIGRGHGPLAADQVGHDLSGERGRPRARTSTSRVRGRAVPPAGRGRPG